MSDLSIVEVTLKPCPFCGSDKIKIAKVRDGREVLCGKCSAAGPVQFHGPASMADAETRAITAWNTRASTASEAERVREACAKVAEERHGKYVEPTVWDYGAQDACVSIAAAIRSLPIGGE